MADATLQSHTQQGRQMAHAGPSWFTQLGRYVGLGVLLAGIGYCAVSLVGDVEKSPTLNVLPYILLGVALLIALGFEFVNGFHDTANAVATVIYTNSMPAYIAVVWSGFSTFSASCFRPAPWRSA